MPKINWYFVLSVVCISFGGIPKGYDEGGFSASVGLKSFVNDYNLSKSAWKDNPAGLANRKANISSFGVLGAAFGAIIALVLSDKLGRLKCWRLFVATWACGLLMQVFSCGIYGLILFARIVSGLGAGGLTVVAPLYLSEIARARSRGMVVSIYMVSLLSVLMIGFFINYGASQGMAATREQYRLVQSIPLIPVGLAFIVSFFLTDTPRWLASQDRQEEAQKALARLRATDPDDVSVSMEFQEILFNCQVKQQQLRQAKFWTLFKEAVTVRSFRTRFALSLVMQTVAQWSGGNGITYYIPEIFEYAGVTGSHTSLITSGAYGAVKLVFTMAFTWGLVDFIGRRRCILIGVGTQCITHVYMAIYMALWRGTDNKSASDAAIASVFIYAAGWSVGLCTVQYIYATEIYPTRIRSVCYATNMSLHWFFQFAVVRVTPNMFVAFDIYGAYIFWAMICFIGAVILGIWAPETKGVPLEKMDELFTGPWYMGWRKKVDMRTPDDMEATKDLNKEGLQVSQVEKV